MSVHSALSSKLNTNTMLGQHAKIRHFMRRLPIQQRLQTRAASAALNASEIETEKSSEWDLGRPYNQIPKVGTAQFAFHMLPGGRYHRKEFPEIMSDLHQRHGSLYRLPGILGKAEFLVSNDPTHFERVYRVEGPWPERQGKSIMEPVTQGLFPGH
ncbi:hypothetical protein ACLKA7_008460 [Drosophila subpalustris]